MVFEEIIRFLDQVEHSVDALLSQINDEEYSKPRVILGNGTIGQHIRHTVNFYQCIQSAIEQKQPIDYSARVRGGALECDRACALQTLKESISALKSYHENWSRTLTIKLLENTEKATTPSSIEREILYACEHGIHHLALVKTVIIADKIDINLPDSFGMAPSTIDFMESACAQ